MIYLLFDNSLITSIKSATVRVGGRAMCAMGGPENELQMPYTFHNGIPWAATQRLSLKLIYGLVFLGVDGGP
jgi:hypothetical protein